jgi:polysaccharide chain length determinant protein (PEP-CTERM system associated)
MSESGRGGSGLERARQVWRRRKWLALAVFTATLAAAFTGVRTLPGLYRSTATVLVERSQVPEAFVRSSVTGEFETRLQTVSQQILSRARLGELIARLDLYPDLRRRLSLEAAIEQMRRDVRLELKGAEQTSGRTATVALALSYLGRDPETVALVANTIASFYVEENLRVRERQATGTAEFLRLQLEETRKRLEQQDRRLHEFKIRHMGELPQQVEANQTALERFNGQLQRNVDLQGRALERRETLAKQLAEAGVPRSDAPSARLARLRQELTQLQTRFTDLYPDVIRVKTEIAALERRLAEPPAGGTPDPAAAMPAEARRLRAALDGTEAEMRALRAEEASLRQSIAAYQARIENAPRRDQEFQDLSRESAASRELYYSMLKRYEDAHLAESMEQRQKGELFRILDPALVPTQPVAPNRFRLLLVGGMLSLALAAGATALAERLDTSFHTADDLRAFTRVPVLARVPRIATRADARRWRWRCSLAAVGALLGLGLIVGASFYVARDNERLVRIVTRGQS